MSDPIDLRPGAEFLDGTLIADGTVARGTILQRSGEDWAPYTDGTGAPAVLTYEAASGPVRVLVSGVVDETQLRMPDGSRPTLAVLEHLRRFGITPIVQPQVPWWLA